MEEWKQDFDWKALGEGGRYEYGRDGYLIVDEAEEKTGVRGFRCRRELSRPLSTR